MICGIEYEALHRRESVHPCRDGQMPESVYGKAWNSTNGLQRPTNGWNFIGLPMELPKTVVTLWEGFVRREIAT